jgi:hypothetical protein
MVRLEVGCGQLPIIAVLKPGGIGGMWHGASKVFATLEDQILFLSICFQTHTIFHSLDQGIRDMLLQLLLESYVTPSRSAPEKWQPSYCPLSFWLKVDRHESHPETWLQGYLRSVDFRFPISAGPKGPKKVGRDIKPV